MPSFSKGRRQTDLKRAPSGEVFWSAPMAAYSSSEGAWERAEALLLAEVAPSCGGRPWAERRVLSWLSDEVEALDGQVAAAVAPHQRGRRNSDASNSGNELWRDLAWSVRVRSEVAGLMIGLQRAELDAERMDVQRDSGRVAALEKGLQQTQTGVIDALELLRCKLRIAQARAMLAPNTDLSSAERSLLNRKHLRSQTQGHEISRNGRGAEETNPASRLGAYSRILAMTFGADEDGAPSSRTVSVADADSIRSANSKQAVEALGCCVLFCTLQAMQRDAQWSLAQMGQQFVEAAARFAMTAGLQQELARAVAGLALLQMIPCSEDDGAKNSSKSDDGSESGDLEPMDYAMSKRSSGLAGSGSDEDDATVMVVAEDVEKAAAQVVKILAPLRLRELWAALNPSYEFAPDGYFVVAALRQRSLIGPALHMLNSASEELWPSLHPARGVVLDILMDDIQLGDRDELWRQQWMKLLVLVRQPPALENALTKVLTRMWKEAQEDRMLLSEIFLKTPFLHEELEAVQSVLESKTRSTDSAETRVAYDMLVALHIMHNQSQQARDTHNEDIERNATGNTSSTKDQDRLKVRQWLVQSQEDSATPFGLKAGAMQRLGGLLENSEPTRSRAQYDRQPQASASSDYNSQSGTLSSSTSRTIQTPGFQQQTSSSTSARPMTQGQTYSAVRDSPSQTSLKQPSKTEALEITSSFLDHLEGATKVARSGNYFGRQTSSTSQSGLSTSNVQDQIVFQTRAEKTLTPSYTSLRRRPRQAMPTANSGSSRVPVHVKPLALHGSINSSHFSTARVGQTLSTPLPTKRSATNELGKPSSTQRYSTPSSSHGDGASVGGSYGLGESNTINNIDTANTLLHEPKSTPCKQLQIPKRK